MSLRNNIGQSLMTADSVDRVKSYSALMRNVLVAAKGETRVDTVNKIHQGATQPVQKAIVKNPSGQPTHLTVARGGVAFSIDTSDIRGRAKQK